jgi:hypothetical protein
VTSPRSAPSWVPTSSPRRGPSHDESVLHPYFGDRSGWQAASSLPGLVASRVPVLFAVAESDPPVSQRQAELLFAALAARGGGERLVARACPASLVLRELLVVLAQRLARLLDLVLAGRRGLVVELGALALDRLTRSPQRLLRVGLPAAAL